MKSINIIVKEGTSEEGYAIPDWFTLELPKPTLRKLRTKPLAWFKNNFNWADEFFNEQRCENLDMVATYRPYHFNGSEFGLYVYTRYFVALLINIMEMTGLSFGRAHAFSLECIQSHGAFHNLIERYTEIQPAAQYPCYKKEVYSQLWGTESCFEETLANAYIFQNNSELDELRIGYLRYLYGRQRDGYAQAAELEKDDISVLYSLLQNQIGRQSAFSLEQWIGQKTPFNSEQLPVYLVNEGLENSEIELVLEAFFPACLGIETRE